ncbi:acetyl-CoA synthetase [Alteribacillus bidgolensis]|uniref:Acetyl-CoA synthetase n=1 Tax=Alteribacillus bidgolensis TaxID=930129 RepID=A0A1G8D178_9BACI|nr:acetyl-CoA synthetase [Alteribacillus bidgolensis]
MYVPLFTAFGPEAIAHRLSVSGSKMLVSNQEQMKKVNNISLVEQIFVIDDDTPPAHNFWGQLENASNHYETEKTTLMDPSIIQFTSGSQGCQKELFGGIKFY